MRADDRDVSMVKSFVAKLQMIKGNTCRIECSEPGGQKVHNAIGLHVHVTNVTYFRDRHFQVCMSCLEGKATYF